MLTLTPRLQMLAQMLPVGGALADVGTDHAYLPVYALINGLCTRAFAGDINSGPLENARATVEKYGVSDRISLILSPGLDKFPESCADTVVIAGMGGEQIADIVSKADWLKSGKITLIVQPMTMHEKCRTSLASLGFLCTETKYACEGSRLYVAEKYLYSPPCDIDGVTAYIGAAAQSGDPLAAEYISRRIIKLKRAADGMRSSPRMREEYERCIDLIGKLNEIIKQKR